MRGTSSRRPVRSNRSSGAISSAACSADRFDADQTFFFLDYQGQRQTIGRTVISTVPTRAAAPGHFHRGDRRARAGYLRSGTTVTGGDGATRSRSRATRFPLARMDPVARALLQRYPLPTSAGTANNYRRSAMKRWTRISSASGSINGSRSRRSAVRPPDAIPGRLHSRDTAAGRQRGHHAAHWGRRRRGRGRSRPVTSAPSRTPV